MKTTLDPKRTVFALNPPREFPSEAAMHYFLNRPENKVVKEKNEALLQQMAGVAIEKKAKTTNG